MKQRVYCNKPNLGIVHFSKEKLPASSGANSVSSAIDGAFSDGTPTKPKKYILVKHSFILFLFFYTPVTKIAKLSYTG